MKDDFRIYNELYDAVAKRIDSLDRRLERLEKRPEPPSKPLPIQPHILGYSIDTPVGKRLFAAYGKAGKVEDAVNELSALHAEAEHLFYGKLPK